MWNKVVTNLIFGRQKYCRLCFSEVDDDDLHFHDEVLLNLNIEKISNMLVYILGGKHTSNMSIHDKFCNACIMSVKNTYNFMKMCKDNSDCLINIIDALNESLKNTEGVKSSKSVLIHIDSTDYSFMQFYQYRRSVRNLPASLVQGHSKFLIANKNKPAKSQEKKIKKQFKKPKKQAIIKPKKEYNNSHAYNTRSVTDKCKDAGTTRDRKPIENEENKNNNSLEHTTEPQVKSYLEKQHFKLKSIIQSTIRASGSRRHILKMNTKRKVTLPPKQKTETESQEPQEKGPGSSEHTSKTLNDSENEETDHRANILRKHKCSDCERVFATKSLLTTHFNLKHSKVSSYICKYCDMGFKASFHLRRHIRREHLEPCAQCDICNARFRGISSIYRHRQRHFEPQSSLYIPKLFPGEQIEVIE